MPLRPLVFLFGRSMMTSPSREISSSFASTRNSFGRRTACELPDLKTFAIGMCRFPYILPGIYFLRVVGKEIRHALVVQRLPMPNLDFYAIDTDFLPVLGYVFGKGVRVFESYSKFDQEIREFKSPDQVVSQLEPA